MSQFPFCGPSDPSYFSGFYDDNTNPLNSIILLFSYCVPWTILSTFHILSTLILTICGVDITPTLQVKRKRLTDWVYKGLYTAYTF